MKQGDYMDYLLLRYAKYFDIERHIHLNAQVASIAQISKDKWLVNTSNATGNKVVEESLMLYRFPQGQLLYRNGLH